MKHVFIRIGGVELPIRTFCPFLEVEMRRLFRKALASVAIISSMSLYSCGESEGQDIVKNLKVVFQQSLAKLDVEFAGNITLNVELTVPVEDYGFVTFVPSTASEGFRIITSLDLSIFEDLRFQTGRTSTLPNGVPFPSYVGTELATYRLKPLDKFGAILYLGVQETNRFIGATVELGFIDEDFPPGATISQKFVDEKGEVLGVVTLYGPRFDEFGNMTAPGGLFAASNLSNLIGGIISEDGTRLVNQPTVKPSEVEIQIPGEENPSPAELQELYERFMERGREAGLIR